MTSPTIAGGVMIAVPLILIAWALLWRRARPVFWFAVALVAIGTGYLMATGAASEIAQRLVPQLSSPPPVRAK